ncbi:MAG: FtsX-like permease family protein [Rikenellaceae bacterium]
MGAQLLIARRYLLSPKSHSVVNIIAGVSLVSLLLPVAAVIVLLSIFNGFSSMIYNMDSAIEGDLTVQLIEGRIFEQSDINREAIEAIEGIEAISFSTEQTLLIEHKDRGTVLTLKGVDQNYTESIPIDEYVDVGKFQVELGDLERIVVGNATASRLGIRSLSDITIDIFALKTGQLQSMIPIGSYNTAQAKLSGVVMIDVETEERYAYASQRLVNRLLNHEDGASKLSIKVSNGADIESIKRKIGGIVGDRFKVESRQELNPAIYQIIRYEKLGVLLICSLVIVLAAFSLLGALTMLIIEKRGDVKTLRSMGTTHSDIRRIFLLEGGIISTVAILAGVVLGIAVTLIQQYFGVVELPSSSMVLQYYPVDLQIGDVVSVVLISGGISLALSYLTVNGVYKKEL